MSDLNVPDELVDEARAFNQELERLLASVPSVHTVPPQATRELRASGQGLFGPIERSEAAVDRSVPGRAGGVRVRQLAPDAPDAVYLHIHGGGWTLGAADQQDLLLETLAREANVAVVSVDYRLAPEDPYPAGPDDCEDAAAWLVEHAADEFGTSRLLIGGESAGAHLAVVTLLRLRDRHGAGSAFAGANLVFGAYDLSMTPSVRRWGDRNLVLSGPIVEWFCDNFLPGRDAEARRHPDISPLYADLLGMPPALFTVGTLDPLLDDTLFMEARWRHAGHATELVVVPEAVHGFTAFPLGLARLGNQHQVDFVRRMAKESA